MAVNAPVPCSWKNEDNVILMDTISKRVMNCLWRTYQLHLLPVTKGTERCHEGLHDRLQPTLFTQILGEAAIDLPDNLFRCRKEAEYLKEDVMYW